MALAYVRDTGKVQGTGVTSLAASFGALPGAGSLIHTHYVGVAGASPTFAATCADNQGNTYTEIAQTTLGGGGSRTGAAMHYAKNIGSPSGTFTVTYSSLPSGDFTMSASEVSGADTTAPLDKFGTNTGASQNSTTAATGALSQAAEIVFAMVGAFPTSQSGGFMTCNTAGYTQIYEHIAPNTNTYGWGEADYKIVAATTTQTVTWTTDYSANDYIAYIVTYKEAAAAGGDHPATKRFGGVEFFAGRGPRQQGMRQW